MPSLDQAINADRSGLTPAEAPVASSPPAPDMSGSQALLRNPFSRCPLPPTNNSPDSLRQWGQGDEVPRWRTFMPQATDNNSGGVSSSSGVVISSSTSGGGSSGGGGSSTPAKAQNASLKTISLGPSQTYLTVVTLAKAFQLLSVTANGPARVELYGTKTAQLVDQSRGVQTAPNSSTAGLILDLVLLSPVLSWSCLDTVGANQDGTQSTTIYATITNLSDSVQTYTVSFVYVPLES